MFVNQELSINKQTTPYQLNILQLLSILCRYQKLALCGGTSYLVGQKDESLRIWDLAKGQEVIPSADMKEQCNSVTEPCYVCPDEPTIILATEGDVYMN